ncbi:hypothetical protein [Gracilimonas mengyeensis]|nr:hypothetical protein [Gracilimonas mengyeensis]
MLGKESEMADISLNKGGGRAGTQLLVIEPKSSFRMIDLPSSTL